VREVRAEEEFTLPGLYWRAKAGAEAAQGGVFEEDVATVGAGNVGGVGEAGAARVDRYLGGTADRGASWMNEEERVGGPRPAIIQRSVAPWANKWPRFAAGRVRLSSEPSHFKALTSACGWHGGCCCSGVAE
jgi:hypothetical protein